MSPNLEQQLPRDDPSHELDSIYDFTTQNLTPVSEFSGSNSLSDDYSSPLSESSHHDIITQYTSEEFEDYRSHVPWEFNLRELLVRVAGTDNLESVTQIKLRVISRDVSLQQLSTYLPFVRELNLDGSVVSSFRDLGCGLKNLKILKVNRCQLTCIDSMSGFENLEEFYIADNEVSDLTPCAFLTSLKVIDVRRNALKNFGSLSFLKLCPHLEHLYVAGNAGCDIFPGYRQVIGRFLPNLKMLDEATLEQDIGNENLIPLQGGIRSEEDERVEHLQAFTPRQGQANLPRTRQFPAEASTGFVVRFPPRVFGERANKSI
ncbi:leucine-rich repeat-containing protein 56 [Cylas formicarius]|uniref:leucine-rich repeat-containing protein 56 n=1 Tax=Cylas formicarius TaxID=197179 RepID=UPI002958C600|nr:leucine-rich repeat-containing protein 56 [Cylas formicarius]